MCKKPQFTIYRLLIIKSSPMIFSAREKKATVGGLIKTTPELRVAIDAVANDLKGKYPLLFCFISWLRLME